MEKYTANEIDRGLREYFEYYNIVGEADNGVLLTPAEYEKFRQRAAKAREHRLYVSWRCMKSGIDCWLVGPSTKCFCNHTYKTHATDNWETRKLFCRAKGCKCEGFHYIPGHGTFRLRCRCKHFFTDHKVTGKHSCSHSGCSCSEFYSPYSCSCGEKWETHQTIIENREEREQSGRPVDNLCGGGEGYEALGGLTGFSSLVDGIQRLDTSGIGRLEKEQNEMAIYESNLRKKPHFANRPPQPKAISSTPFLSSSSSNRLDRKESLRSLIDKTEESEFDTELEEKLTSHRVVKNTSKQSLRNEKETRSSMMSLQEELDEALSDPNLSEAQRYALKKKIMIKRANEKKLQKKELM